MQGDAELLRLYASERSEAAFAELVRRHVNLVYGAALRQLGGDAHAAEDVTQAVFTDLARKAGAVAGREVIASWLYTSTRFATANLRRARGRRHKHETEAELMRAIDATPATDWEKLRPLVDDAMHELNERERGAVVLRFFESRPFAEIGEAYGLSEDAARMRVDRALEKLRALLARRGVTSTSAALSVALTAHTAMAAPAGLASSVTGAALAGAAGTTAAAGVGIFTFMSTAKITATIIVAGGLAGVGFGLYAIQRSQAAEESLAALTAERSAWQAKLRDADARAEAAEKRAMSTETRATDPQKAMARASTKPTAGRGSTASAAELANARDKLEKVKEKLGQAVELKISMMADPEVQRARLEVERTGMGLRFSQLYRNLNLTPEQVARFEARWIESRQETADIFSVAKSNGVEPNDPAIVALANEAKTKYENDLRTILGEAGFAEYQNYERSYPAREVAGGLVANLMFAGSPLSTGQLNQLTRTIAEQSAGYQKGERVAERGNDVNWGAVVAQAQQFLSPAQVDLVRAHAAYTQASQQAMRTSQQAMDRATIKVPADGAAPRKPSGG